MKSEFILKMISLILITVFSLTTLSSCCCCDINKIMSAIKTPVPQTPLSASTEKPEENNTVVKEESVKIDALYYVGTNPPSGGTSEVKIKVSPNTQGELRVGFFEEEVQGTGNMWRSSGWMAVVLSTMLLGLDATDYEFSFSVGGRIDGPSAGGLMTVGVLAALRGKEIKNDATMTGTINPDGTIGPVGGIPYKLHGAAKKGKKLVLIPVGQRYEENVDLIEKGKKLGIEVKEVSNVYDAYNLLTGDTIPKMSASTSAPHLPSKAFERTKGKTKEWYSRYQKARSEYKMFPQEYQYYFSAQVNELDQLASKADGALAQGMVCVAYDRAFEAAMQMEAIVLAMNMIQRYLQNGFRNVINYLESKQTVKTDLSGILDQLKSEDISTASDYIAIFNAYSKVSMTKGLILIADSKVNNISKNAKSYSEEQILQELIFATLYYTIAGAFIDSAKDSLDVAKGFGTDKSIKDKEQIRKLGDIFSGASKANMAYFESTIVDEYAQAYGQHPNTMKNYFMQFDTRYMLAYANGKGAEWLTAEFSSQKESAPMIIGEAASSYTLSAQLIAKYYSLDAKLNQNLTEVVSIGNEKALADMLDFADRRALELINMNGEENSVLSIFYYENARLLRQGKPEDQIEALGYYWEATILGELQGYMSGKLGKE